MIIFGSFWQSKSVKIVNFESRVRRDFPVIPGQEGEASLNLNQEGRRKKRVKCGHQGNFTGRSRLLFGKSCPNP